VKVVCAADGRALYFSRLPIPCSRDVDAAQMLREDPGRSPWLLHMGIYAYRPEFLLTLTQLPPSRLEQLEKLEQLRALEAGASILVVTAKHASRGIDTSADYLAFVERQRR
jgi:3-deoxy-manno-octulosonate cytidylyltransferase (CMP-KDO synthetase)